MFWRMCWMMIGILAPMVVAILIAKQGRAQTTEEESEQTNEQEETRQLVALVNDAAKLVATSGEVAFQDFRKDGSKWRQGETYIFVLDPSGKMVVHPDPELEGKNEMGLKDVNGKPIVKGLVDAAMSLPEKPEGWYHYEWPVPGGLLPRWKSSYVRLVTAPSGERYIVGSGMYNDRMERAFVVDVVKEAAGQLEAHGKSALELFHDPTGPFLAKDTYVFVYDMKGRNLALPAFPNLEGRNLIDLKDSQGKFYLREMLDVVNTKGSGWVDYMWPKPGESVSTEKSAFVTKARMGNQWVLVGSGVYLAEAPKAAQAGKAMTAPELMALVRAGAAVLEKEGEKAYSEFRTKGSQWLNDKTYFFVVTMSGRGVFHAADPSLEGVSIADAKDVLGRPYGKWYIETASSAEGEGWVHYMFPEPGGVFPAWKSAFVKRVTYPSGKQYIAGSAVYNMQMDRALIKDVVNRASALVAERGPAAFEQLRDKTGPFHFMNTYVFVDDLDGVDLVNPGHPGLEGKNMMDVKDVNGKPVMKALIETATKDGGWVDYMWYKPGSNQPARKESFVRRVQFGDETYIVGSGLYVETD